MKHQKTRPIMNNTEIVNKLIGSVKPVGGKEIDASRLENLKALCELTGDLMGQIKEVAQFKDRQAHSVRKMGEFAFEFLSDETYGLMRDTEGIALDQLNKTATAIKESGFSNPKYYQPVSKTTRDR